MMKQRKAIVPGAYLLALLCVAANAQVSAPRLGCYSKQGSAFDILGIPGAFVVRSAQSCAPVPNAWTITRDPDNPGAWLERREALSHAVESRTRLGPGSWGVFADGTALRFDSLELPAPVRAWKLIAPDWMIVRTAQASILIRADGQWFYLPMPVSGGAPE